MGFAPVQANGDWFTSAVGSLSVTLPTGIKDGDLVVLYIFQNNGTAITPPTGYTINGSVITISTNTANGLYTKVWHTGDAKSGITFTTTSGAGNTAWLCCIVRSTSAASIVSHLTALVTPASTTLPFPKFPPTTVGNLRLAFAHCSAIVGGFTLVPPTPAVSALNPTSLKFQLVGQTTNTGLPADLYYSLWEDPAGADANTENWTSGSGVYGLRSVVFDDGSASWTGTQEVALNQSDPGILADTLSGANESLPASKGSYMGGAHIL